MSKRLNQDRQNRLQPMRIDQCRQSIIGRGGSIYYEDQTQIKFAYQGINVTIFPYSGWYAGKGIGSGRGFQNMWDALKQI